MNGPTDVVFITWVIFWLYWFASAIGVKKNTAINQRIAGVRLIIFILAVSIIKLQIFKSLNNPIHSPPIRITGLVIFFTGLVLAVFARLKLGNNWGFPMSEKQNAQLITNGPYKLIRHPIYSGILLAMLGTALVSGLDWLVLLFILSVYFSYSAVVEEKIMARLFKADYANYKKRTKMLIPYIL